MNEHDFFQKTFSNLHASDDTLHKVLKKAYGHKGTTRISKRFAVLVAVLVMVFSTVLAAHATGFLADLVVFLTPAKDPGYVIEQAYGDSISTQKPEMEDAYGNPIEAPSMERPAVDLTETEKLIGAYISDVDGVVSIGENTFTLKNFLIDETGSGAVTWTVENPNGINYGDVGYGIVSFNPSPFDEPTLYHYAADGTKKDVLNVTTALISKNGDGTKLELVSYFGTVAKYQIGDTLTWMVSRNRKQETQKIQITPVAHVPAMTMPAEDGVQLTISNQGLTIHVNSDMDFISDRIAICFKDGTQYCVEDDAKKIFNTSGAFWRHSETYRYSEVVYLFNRIIDTREIASVEVDAHRNEYRFNGKGWDHIHQTKQYVFYP